MYLLDFLPSHLQLLWSWHNHITAHLIMPDGDIFIYWAASDLVFVMSFSLFLGVSLIWLCHFCPFLTGHQSWLTKTNFLCVSIFNTVVFSFRIIFRNLHLTSQTKSCACLTRKQCEHHPSDCSDEHLSHAWY